MNDGSLGPLIPYLLESYRINTSFVSIVYIVTFFGWFVTALTNSHLTRLLDTGAILVMGAILQTLAHILRAIRPPFGVFAAGYAGEIFFGRLLLAEPIYRFGERKMILLYILLCTIRCISGENSVRWNDQ